METKDRSAVLRRVVRGILAGLLVALALAFVWPVSAAWAQSVYKTPGGSGQAPVFSDKPLPGAREVSLPPLNVIESAEPKTAPTTRGHSDQGGEKGSVAGESVPTYRSFSVVFPENEGSVVANTAVFEVRLAVEPALQLGAGHAFVVSLNGRPVGQRFTATEFMIPPEFWGDTLPPPNQRMQLDAAIVDRDGRVLRQALPVSFFMRHATRLQHPANRPVPLPLPQNRPAGPGGGAMLPSPSMVQGQKPGQLVLDVPPESSMREPAPRKAAASRAAP